MSFEHKQMKMIMTDRHGSEGTHAQNGLKSFSNLFRLVDVVGPVHISGMDDPILILVTHHHLLLVVARSGH